MSNSLVKKLVDLTDNLEDYADLSAKELDQLFFEQNDEKARIALYSRLTDIDLVELFRNKGDKIALEVLFSRYIRYIFRIAKSYSRSNLDNYSEDDFLTVGILGVFEAILKHDPSKNKKSKFRYYMAWKVRFEILGYIRNYMSKFVSTAQYKYITNIHSLLLRLLNSFYLEKKLTSVDLTNIYGILYNLRENFKKLTISPKLAIEGENFLNWFERDLENINEFKVYNARKFISYFEELTNTLRYPIQPLDDEFNQIQSNTNLEEGYAKKGIASILQKQILNLLSPREQFVIICRYYEKLTLDEVGRMLGVTKERVRQIEAGALLKLRNKLRKISVNDISDAID